jgi:PEP-CTERM motif-containing protein
VNNNPDGCGPDGGPACFVGGLVLAVGAGGNGQGLGNGSVTIESITGSPVPEPSTWAMMAIGFVGLGFMGWRAGRERPRP